MTNDSESAIIIDVKERKKYQFKKTKSCFVGAKLVIKIFRKFKKGIDKLLWICYNDNRKKERNKQKYFQEKIKNLEKVLTKSSRYDIIQTVKRAKKIKMRKRFKIYKISRCRI